MEDHPMIFKRKIYDKLLKFIDVDMNHIEAIKSENQELLQEIQDLRDELDDKFNR